MATQPDAPLAILEIGRDPLTVETFAFDQQTPGKPEALLVERKLQASVARGQVNQLNSRPPEGLYLFVADVEHVEEADDWVIHTEWVEKRWMESVWAELRGLEGGAEFQKIWQGRNWDKEIDALMEQYAGFFYRVFEWYLQRVVDVARGLPSAGFLKLRLPADNAHAKRFTIGEWFWVPQPLLASPDPADPSWLPGELTTTGLDFEEWRKVGPCWIAPPLRLAEAPTDGTASQGAMQMIHFMQADPFPTLDGTEIGFGAGASSPSGEGAAQKAPDPGTGGASQARMALGERLRRAGRGAVQRLESWLEPLLDDLADALRPPLVPAFAGAGIGAPMPVRPRAAAAPDVHGSHAYIGYPVGGIPLIAPGGPLAQVANPMVIGGGAQPFIGILSVGEANCNALYDNRGKAIVYFDLGLPIAANNPSEPAPRPLPCFCDDPLVILSHWDEDHYAMGFAHAAARALRWIVPQQQMRRGGTQVLQLIASIINGGGEVRLWTTVGLSHMRFPWGFVERSTGAGNTNRSGLNAYVCVADTGGNAQLGWVAAGATLGCAPGTYIGGLGTVTPTAAVPPHRAAATNASAAVPVANANARSDAIARAIAVSPNARAAGLPNAATIGRIAALAESAAAAGGNAAVITIAVAAGIRLVPAGVTVANTVTAAGNAAGALNGVVFANNGLAIAAAAGASALGVAAHDQDVGEIANGVMRNAAGPADLQLAQAAVAGAVTNAIGVQAAVIAAAVTAARAAAAANAGDELGLAVHATGGTPALATTRAPLGPMLNNRGPASPNERYVLLTGDALYRFVSSQMAAPPPPVVALNAPHHGANQDGADKLLAAEIPWAPASDEARCGAAAAAAFAAPVPAAATAVAAAVALHMATPRPALVRMSAVAIHAARLGGDARVVTVAAGLSKGTALTANALQAAQAAVVAGGVVAARLPNATTAADILGDGGFLAATAGFAAARAEIAAVAASIAGGPPGAINVMAAAAAAASAAGAGDANLIEAVVRSTQKARVVATVLNSMVTPLAGAAVYPCAPIDWDTATFAAPAAPALSAAQYAHIYLAPDVASDRRLVCTAAAFAGSATVRAHGISRDCSVHAVDCVLAAANAGYAIAVRAVAAAVSHAFHIASNASIHAAQDILDERGKLSAHMERHAMQSVAALANAAVAAVPGAGNDVAAAAVVAGDANVLAAVRTFAQAQTFTLGVLVAVEARVAGAHAQAEAVAIAWALDNLATVIAATDIVAAAVHARGQALNGGGRAAQIVADAAGVAAAGNGMALVDAQTIVGLAWDIRNPGFGLTGIEEVAATLRLYAGGRRHLVDCIGECQAAATSILTARTFLARAAVSAVRHAAGATAAQLAAVLDIATLGGGVSSLPTTFVRMAVEVADAAAAAGGNYFAQFRDAADAAAVNRAVVMAAAWGGIYWDMTPDWLPVVEAAAAEGVGVELSPVTEGVSSAIVGRGASATVAADFPAVTTASRKLAYSYGVKWNGANPPFAHCHRAGQYDTGPADPVADSKYRAHGWTGRLNTPTNAANGKQPGVNGGHIALGWEVVGGMLPYEGPLQLAPAGTCPTCNNAGNGNPTAFII